MLATLPKDGLATLHKDGLATLPKDTVILIAQFVYGDDKIKIRKDGSVSFRILNIPPCMYRIPKFTVYVKIDNRSGISSVNSKTLFLGKKTIKCGDEGWLDYPAMLDNERGDGESGTYRRTEFAIKITNPLAKPFPVYEFISTVILPTESSSGQYEMIAKCDRRSYYMLKNGEFSQQLKQ